MSQHPHIVALLHSSVITAGAIGLESMKENEMGIKGKSKALSSIVRAYSYSKKLETHTRKTHKLTQSLDGTRIEYSDQDDKWKLTAKCVCYIMFNDFTGSAWLFIRVMFQT